MSAFLGAIISSVLCSIVFAIARRKSKKIEMDANDFTVRQPKTSLTLYKIVTCFFFIIFALGFIPIIYEDIKKLPTALSFLPFLSLGPVLIVLWHRWEIAIKGNQITSTSYFGKKKSFTFDYITKAKQGINRTRMGEITYIIAYHDKEKLFSLSDICPGFNTLLSRLEKEGVPIEN